MIATSFDAQQRGFRVQHDSAVRLAKEVERICRLHRLGTGKNSDKAHFPGFLDNRGQVLAIEAGRLVKIEWNRHFLVAEEPLEQQQIDQNLDGDGGAIGFDGIKVGVPPSLAVCRGDLEVQVKEVAEFHPPVLLEQFAQLVLSLIDPAGVEK